MVPRSNCPVLAITPGEPAGIGPDVLIQTAQNPQQAHLLAFADIDLLQSRARQLGLPLTLHHWQGNAPIAEAPVTGEIWCKHIPLGTPCSAGQPNPDNIPYVLECLTQASQACLKGDCAGLVTGPVNKGLFLKAGVHFSGHTEFLAQVTHSEQVVMMLATPGLRVALMTTHLPLAQVPKAITPERIHQVIQVIHRHLGHYLKRTPRIYVLGLNPHAGDHGALGTEEQLIIGPCLDQLRSQGIDLVGPLSADTAFSPDNLADADVFLAMYHDQGLPVLKHKGFGQAVNITLGLKILRASVDHGTAFDLAGSGQSNPGSLQYAIQTLLDFLS